MSEANGGPAGRRAPLTIIILAQIQLIKLQKPDEFRCSALSEVS